MAAIRCNEFFKLTTKVHGAATYSIPSDKGGLDTYAIIYGDIHTQCAACRDIPHDEYELCCEGACKAAWMAGAPVEFIYITLKGVWPNQEEFEEFGQTQVTTNVSFLPFNRGVAPFQTEPIKIPDDGGLMQLSVSNADAGLPPEYVVGCCVSFHGARVIPSPDWDSSCNTCDDVLEDLPPEATCCKISTLYAPGNVYPEHLIPDNWGERPDNDYTEEWSYPENPILLRVATKSDTHHLTTSTAGPGASRSSIWIPPSVPWWWWDHIDVDEKGIPHNLQPFKEPDDSDDPFVIHGIIVGAGPGAPLSSIWIPPSVPWWWWDHIDVDEKGIPHNFQPFKEPDNPDDPPVIHGIIVGAGTWAPRSSTTVPWRWWDHWIVDEEGKPHVPLFWPDDSDDPFVIHGTRSSGYGEENNPFTSTTVPRRWWDHISVNEEGKPHVPLFWPDDDDSDDPFVIHGTRSSGYGYGEENNPFTSLNSVVYQNGQTAVTWSLDPNFEDQGPYSYYLEVAPSDAPVAPGEFERLNPTNPVVDHSGYILDETMRRYSFDNRAVYRVVLETPRGIYVSAPEKPNGNLPPNLLRVYKEILRKERLRLNPKMGGTAGMLFKRRTFGPKCVEAIDKNTGQVIDYNNTECYGTEFIGGYFEGLEYPMLYTSGESYTSEITQMGTQEPHTISTRALVYPMPASKDVWYEQAAGRAFYIDNVTITSKFSAKPLSLKIEMKMAAPTDIIYDFIDVQAELDKLT